MIVSDQTLLQFHHQLTCLVRAFAVAVTPCPKDFQPLKIAKAAIAQDIARAAVKAGRIQNHVVQKLFLGHRMCP